MGVGEDDGDIYGKINFDVLVKYEWIMFWLVYFFDGGDFYVYLFELVYVMYLSCVLVLSEID